MTGTIKLLLVWVLRPSVKDGPILEISAQGRPERVRRNSFVYLWTTSEILNFENRTIFKGDMAKNVSTGEIQAVDLCPSWDLHPSPS